MGLKHSNRGLVESFFIQHSLPRFPLRHSNQSGFFDSNIDAKAQHFICISMRDEFEQETEKSPIRIESVQTCNFFKLLWNYVRTVNVSFLEDQRQMLRWLPRFFPILQHIIKIPGYLLAERDLSVYKIDPLTSFSIYSTGSEDDRLHFQIFSKTPENHIDIYDDVTALLSIHHEDYKNIGGATLTGHSERKSAMLMVVQSHADSSTLGANQKTLIDRHNFFATVHILNSLGVELPESNGKTKRQHSMYHDHSKWSVNAVYGIEGAFPPLLCFYDLNRSTKQTSRGGGAFCLNSTLTKSSKASRALWQFFMELRPKPTNIARFNNANIPDILSQIVPPELAELTVSDITSPSPAQEYCIHSTRSKRHRSNSYSSLSPVSFIECSPLLSVSKFSDSLLEVIHPDDEDSTFVPCPYKFSTTLPTCGKYHHLDSVPTESVCKFVSVIQNYGLEKFNRAISSHGLFVDKLQRSIGTPHGTNISSYTPTTLRIGRSIRPSTNSAVKRKPSEIEAFDYAEASASQETTETELCDDFTSRYLSYMPNNEGEISDDEN